MPLPAVRCSMPQQVEGIGPSDDVALCKNRYGRVTKSMAAGLQSFHWASQEEAKHRGLSRVTLRQLPTRSSDDGRLLLLPPLKLGATTAKVAATFNGAASVTPVY